MGLFDELDSMKPWTANEIALKLELQSRRDRWESRSGDLYRGGGDYMLRHGRFFHGRALPDAWAPLHGEANACFNNSMEAAMAHRELRYFEGVFGSQGNFTPHAWCVDQAGEVVELTWVTRPDQGLGEYVSGNNTLGMLVGAPERTGYWGVEFDPELIHWFAYEHAGEFCMFDRPAYDAASMVAGGMDGSQDHDFEIYRYPYDPTMKEFPGGTPTP